ncbi:MAG: FxsA family protein [Gammaproteobacteria bacterium]|nr:FxsA family protein [Gammaproteobacteria bacterium]
MSFQRIFLIFLIVVPVFEIYLLLKIGSVIGVIPTIFSVVATAVIGSWMLRQQGFSTLQRLQQNLAQGSLPARELIEGPILLVGGALLLTPGFVTDAIGFCCLIPSTRDKVVGYALKHLVVPNASSGQSPHNTTSKTIDGDYIRHD